MGEDRQRKHYRRPEDVVASSEPPSSEADWEARRQAPLAMGPAAYVPVMSFINMVRNELVNCELYFKIVEAPSPTFKIEVLAFANVNGKHFAASLRTGSISAGSTHAGLEREANILVDGISRVLGAGVFRGKTQPIPEESFKMLVEPA